MEKLFSVERKSEILKLLDRHGRVGVNEVSARLRASPETIRRDLREMETQGLLRRTHGGAVIEAPSAASLPEFPVGARQVRMAREKDLICRTAASFIEDGDTLFADNSSTCLYLVRHIPRHFQVTLITNALELAAGTLETPHPGLMLVCLGGFFNPANLSTYGTPAQKNAAEYFPAKAFLSCAGVQASAGLTDSSLLEVDTKRMMIQRSRQVFLLADHTKLGRSAPYFLADLSAIHHLVTDPGAAGEQLSALAEAGLKVHLADQA